MSEPAEYDQEAFERELRAGREPECPINLDLIRTTTRPKQDKKVAPAAKPVPRAGDAMMDATSIITTHFQEKYRPDFKRGNAIHTAIGEIVPMGVACELPTSGLIGKLALATNAPVKNGNVVHEALPSLFRKWAKVAWADLLELLPDEDTAKLGKGTAAADEFKRLVRDVMLTQIVIGDIIGRNDVTRTERRSLIDWCQKWAKVGPWKSIRSYLCWCKYDMLPGGELVLRVAVRVGLFAQLRGDRLLCGLNQNSFARRAERYGVGVSDRDARPQGKAAVTLAADFVQELTAGLPDDEEAEDLEEQAAIAEHGGG